MKKIQLFTVLILFFNLVQSQEIKGDWYGNLKVSGTEIPLIFHIDRSDAGFSSTLDSPKQGAFGLNAEETFFEDAVLKITLPGRGITYDGIYDFENDMFKGTFKQGGLELPLVLTKNKEIEGNGSEKPLRPQEPKAPFSYRSENITFTNPKDNITLSGTLTLPKSLGKYPAVVLISGSGPQDRNSEILGHKPFLVIADYLTQNGIAVLRFDERGVKESQGDFSKATSKNLATDVQAALHFLQSMEEIDQDKIGLIGHSEGGIIAPMVAENSKEVDFIVLLAGQGLRGDQNLLLQKKLMEQRSGIDELTVNQGQKIFSGAYNIINELESEELQSKLKEYFQQQFSGGLNENQMQALIQQLTSPWMRFYLSYDPALVLEKTTIPVLALFGENDFQVPPKENSGIITESLEKAGNNQVKVIVFEQLNHLFQESSTGFPNEYAEIEQTISPKVLETISTWILSRE
ncbi:alpha/beta fold hydrolase [Salegentibacter sp. LM13S]|uniref:alpha/beta hydrolase family protein n=1 Tax=Salegentibacter lacus TaxID=2873599 RepID=UPI001CCDAEC9|nr:alpha/beta fold hydrolase [Salegentibacter lacus]MBZ9632225.1 alpha/beta fold hydrolase [Salegentibacter lacus]